MAPAAIPERKVRISKIAGRFLVFDLQDVSYLRRQHGISGVFIGTMPQTPTQNIFLGLPVELFVEEVRLLVDREVAYVADSATAHLSFLRSMDESTRETYVRTIKAQRKTAQQVYYQEQAARESERRQRYPPPCEPSKRSAIPDDEISEESLFSTPTPRPVPPSEKVSGIVSLTPTTSRDLIDRVGAHSVLVDETKTCSSYRFLNATGNFFSPGLRFGGDFSVYPGDPFRFHAHFLAKIFGWNEKIAMLDVVTSGRLGTCVKKNLLIGGQKPGHDRGENGEDDPDQDGTGDGVRMFSIEWAGM